MKKSTTNEFLQFLKLVIGKFVANVINGERNSRNVPATHFPTKQHRLQNSEIIRNGQQQQKASKKEKTLR
jgi:hypothetical protein